ncbi:flippase-like domain-containing protein, partial [candidate division KSB1 bacterium]|nr:flippase-like domain-containing protein [candidate division KSB1 bacterium]
MKNKKSVNRILFLIGILISITLVYFSVVNVDLNKVIAEIRSSNYVYILPAVLIMFAGHWLRSIRWKMLLSPHQPIATRHLFSALMIGYLGNTVLPAHMGELIRSYIIKKKTGLPGSLVFGTIVLERFLDVLSLIIIMIVTLMVYPFPGWLYRSALAVTISIIVLLVLFTLFKAKGDVLLSIFSKSIGLFSERMAKIWSSKIKNFV